MLVSLTKFNSVRNLYMGIQVGVVAATLATWTAVIAQIP